MYPALKEIRKEALHSFPKRFRESDRLSSRLPSRAEKRLSERTGGRTARRGSLTFDLGRAALGELENDPVGAHRLLLVAVQQVPQGAEVLLGAAEVVFARVRLHNLAVLVLHRSVQLRGATRAGEERRGEGSGASQLPGSRPRRVANLPRR